MYRIVINDDHEYTATISGKQTLHGERVVEQPESSIAAPTTTAIQMPLKSWAQRAT